MARMPASILTRADVLAECTFMRGGRKPRVTTASYMVCSFLAGLGGLLFVLDIGSAQPVDFGNFYELYAIAAAMLGGCSLRGGTGSIVGVVLGAAVLAGLVVSALPPGASGQAGGGEKAAPKGEEPKAEEPKKEG